MTSKDVSVSNEDKESESTEHKFPSALSLTPTAAVFSTSTKSVSFPPSYITIASIFPSAGTIPSNSNILECPPSSSLNIPSGIIPLVSTPNHSKSNQNSYSVAQLGELANFSANLTHTTNTQEAITPVVISTCSPLPVPHLDAPPPPPYSSDVNDDFSCSSPSQFLHSPKTIHLSSSFEEKTFEKAENSHTVDSLRQKLLNLNKSKMSEIKVLFDNMLQERFFLEGSGNMMDFQVWVKKPNILKDQYLKQHDLDCDLSIFQELLSPSDLPNLGVKLDTDGLLEQDPTIDVESISQQSLQTVSFVPHSSTHSHLYNTNTIALMAPSPSLTASSPRPPLRMPSTISSVTDISHEDIVMRARHEADVMKAISELRKDGLWSASRLPKVQEPAPAKTHWDYLLEEMHWLAVDFSNERRWKLNAAKKLCRAVARRHHEHELHIQRTQREELSRLRKIASTLAKEVRHFWDSIQKIVEHKQQTLLEEKRRRAIDIHLNYIVDQTEKYSSWLMEGFNGPSPSDITSGQGVMEYEDDVFVPTIDGESDDEETINKEELCAEKEGTLDYQSEVHMLQMESEMPLSDILASLPPDMLVEYPLTSDDIDVDKSAVISRISPDDLKDNEKQDDSSKLSTAMIDGDDDDDDDDDENGSLINVTPHGEEQTSCYSSSEEESYLDDEKLQYNSELEYLVSGKNFEETKQGLSNVAAALQEFQPTGITLSTTYVRTKIPVLLKHQLREYQHIGLDWLVTMHEHSLNGILADEMGLGKTIQTIALLAHLACEKGVWGPHLVIVPTSVMLNWEFEFKKWCPGFKILTYFGSFKERKQKRIGWSKFNAFHVCITSYNIAVQDHRAFKQKKWKYLILDEAQNIKNFKSQRWQTLLTFNSQHRLLLTGTPLQNNLMELWSLMHFLMPTIFASHSDFKEWFSNPLSGMVEGSEEYNESIVLRLHQVLRPFLLRRLKCEVEKQLPNKYEHIILCKLSKRQRYLYEEYMSRAKTKESLNTGNYLSVINVLMQLRKVCNHPDLFEPRPVILPLRMHGLVYTTASLVLLPLLYDPFKHVSMDFYNFNLATYELTLSAFSAHRSRQLQAPRSLLLELGDTETEDGLSTSFYKEAVPSWFSFVSTNESGFRSRAQRDILHRVNSFRCRKQPVYGSDMMLAVCTLYSSKQNLNSSHWLWSGYLHCFTQQIMFNYQFRTQYLHNLIMSYQDRIKIFNQSLKRFIVMVLPVTAPLVSLHVCHPHPSYTRNFDNIKNFLHSQVAPLMILFHPISTSFEFQFPETRLIQYDCGKLQILDMLMRKLRSESHRVLVFTQMSRMLDVLEIFLTFHGYTYLRLDGATPVQKRQILMDRFNKDTRIFCFILSTRSGGLGVNLTGADTVVFYDSDWNPTMDAQAQDRCHRIGQTRDVHIYRLVCESTIEENILKKATQKKMLGDLAIESGSFTTDFFMKSSLNDILTEDNVQLPVSNTKQLEELLLQAEEDRDVEAAKSAKAEQMADLAEFDEQYHSDFQIKEVEYKSHSHYEMTAFEEQLSSIEQYVMRFIEAECAEQSEQQLQEAEETIKHAKKEWELSHLQQLREQEERMVKFDSDEQEVMSVTYDRPELVNKMLIDEDMCFEMPIWLPPTPPRDNDDSYVDLALYLTYNISSVMDPESLAASAIYSDDDYDVFGLLKVPSESKAMKGLRKSTSKYKRESVVLPQSLFWRRYTPDVLTTRIRKLSPQTKKVKSKADQFTPLLEAHEGPEWLATEDWILIKGLTSALDFPLSLSVTVPAQMPNWTILADLVSSLCKNKRSALQCKDHLIGFLIPREEQVDELEVKKYKSSRDCTMKKTKSRQEQRSFNQLMQDKGLDLTNQFNHCFTWIMKTHENSKQQIKQSSTESSPRSSMHIELLQKEYDVVIGTVFSPSYLAHQRAERIQSEMPRSSQVHQLLAQNSAYNVQVAHLARPYGSSYIRPAITIDSTKTLTDTPLITTTTALSVARSTAIPVNQKHQPVVVSSCISTDSITTQIVHTSNAVETSSFQLLSKTSQFSFANIVATPTTTLSPVSTSSISNAAVAAAAAVAKTYQNVDISKGLFFGQRLTPQQILLLRQTALQQQHLQQQQQQLQHKVHQQLSTSQPSPPHIQVQRHTQSTAKSQGKVNTVIPQQTSTMQLSGKLQIPGIEQLRPTIALSTQRVPNTFVRAGLQSRSMQTEEVLALLRQQQALRLAMQQQNIATTKLSASQSTPQSSIYETTGASVATVSPSTVKLSPKPSVVAPVENVKTPADQVSTIESSQLNIELLEHTPDPKRNAM